MNALYICHVHIQVSVKFDWKSFVYFEYHLVNLGIHSYNAISISVVGYLNICSVKIFQVSFLKRFHKYLFNFSMQSYVYFLHSPLKFTTRLKVYHSCFCTLLPLGYTLIVKSLY